MKEKRRNTIHAIVVAAVVICIVSIALIGAVSSSFENEENSDLLIGIIGAMDEETSALISNLQDVNVEETASTKYYLGTNNGLSFVIGTSKVGKVYAALTTQQMIDLYHPDCIINIGVGGSLDENLNIGDIVLLSSSFQHDYDVSPLGSKPCHLYENNMMYIPADTSLNNILKKSGEELNFKMIEGIGATGDQFIADITKKEEINQKYGATVCDMEGATILLVCYENKVPAAVCRIISDTLYGNQDEYKENLSLQGNELSSLITSFSNKKKELSSSLL